MDVVGKPVEQRTREQRTMSVYSMIEVEFAFPEKCFDRERKTLRDAPWYPLFYRRKDGSILFPAKGNGRYCRAEVLQAYNLVRQTRPDMNEVQQSRMIKLRGAWEFICPTIDDLTPAQLEAIKKNCPSARRWIGLSVSSTVPLGIESEKKILGIWEMETFTRGVYVKPGIYGFAKDFEKEVKDEVSGLEKLVEDHVFKGKSRGVSFRSVLGEDKPEISKDEKTGEEIETKRDIQKDMALPLPIPNFGLCAEIGSKIAESSK
jgi:hypothetical protein